jgi:hypothetical protein
MISANKTTAIPADHPMGTADAGAAGTDVGEGRAVGAKDNGVSVAAAVSVDAAASVGAAVGGGVEVIVGVRLGAGGGAFVSVGAGGLGTFVGGGAVGTVCALAVPTQPGTLLARPPPAATSAAAAINRRGHATFWCSIFLSSSPLINVFKAWGGGLLQFDAGGGRLTGRGIHRTMPRPMSDSKPGCRLRWILLAAAILLAAGVGVECYRTYRAVADLRMAAAELQAMAQADPAALDLQAAAERMHRARLDAEVLQANARLLAALTDRMHWIPRYGPTLAAAAPLADYAASLTAAGDEMLGALQPLLAPAESAGPASGTSLSTRLVSVLASAEPRLAAAESELQQAQTARGRFKRDDLPAAFRDNLDQADRLLPLAEQGLAVLRQMPEILGTAAPRAYLLVAQNQDELRATGGFISGIGTIEFDGGRISGLSIGDSYSVDDLSKIYPLPPEPLQRYQLAGQWLPRDANWSPDFPTSAAQIQKLYTFSTGKVTDGVIAFDLTAVSRILAVTGPVQVENLREPISAANVESYIHQAWSPAPGQGINQAWWQHRKDFMGQLGAAIVAKLQDSSDRGLLVALARQALALMRQKHLLVYVDDPQVSALLSVMGLSGALQAGPGDFLMVVDSNLGFNKMDPRVERSLSYTVDLRQPGAPQAALVMRYRNTVTVPVFCQHRSNYGTTGYEGMQARCYWDYVRVYAPPGTNLLGGRLPPTPGKYLLTGVDEPGTWTSAAGERGTTEFSGLFVLPTAQEAELCLEYRLPEGVWLEEADGSRAYSLRLSKQPGTEGTPVTVTVLLPAGAQVREAAGWIAQSPDRLVWQGRLVTNASLRLTLTP